MAIVATPPSVAWHAEPPDRCLALARTTPDGLSAAEAEARLRQSGRNELPRPATVSVFGLFLRQFRSPLIYLLLIAAVVSFAVKEQLNSFFIMAVLLINALVGAFQERRAETSMAELQKLIRQVARARREGHLVEVDAADLVPGDIISLESGMGVPADARLLSSSGLSADESSLTGESMPAGKDAGQLVDSGAGLADRPNMVFAGTIIAEGRGSAVVVATGSATALGSIDASLRNAAAPAPPLVLRLQRLARQIAVGAMLLILLLAIMLSVEGAAFEHILILAIALAVSAIPEGLPIAVTVALAVATRRMAGRNVIVRSLPAVEGLGACTLIASDKTGTLTLNHLSVERILLPSGAVISGDWKSGKPGEGGFDVITAGAVCNEAHIVAGTAVGDAVDVALLELARSAGRNLEQLGRMRRLAVEPYEPAKKFAAVVVQEGEEAVLYVKGAPEAVLAMCGGVEGSIRGRVHDLAAEGYRVLAFAAANLKLRPHYDIGRPADLRLLGFAALLDPIRPEVPAAIERCRRAGISVRMVTGDHPETALAIARQIGISVSRDEVVTGPLLAELAGNPGQLVARVQAGRVFARIEPTQKLTIVEALSAAGELVAVTGDGVNDAPALQAAHIGVAMGRSGTDVARGASDLVLADDNFASIVAGIEEGRITYANVRKIVIFLLATGAAEIGMFLGALAMGLPMPLTPVQLLWLNLVTNGVQDVTLGFGRGEGDELSRPPRDPRGAIVDRSAIRLLLPPALAMTVIVLVMMHWTLSRGATVAEAQNHVLFLTVLFQNVYVLCMRSERRSVFEEPLWSNPLLPWGVLLAVGLQLVAMNWEPLGHILGAAPLDLPSVLLCLGGALLIVIVTEITKAVGAKAG